MCTVTRGAARGFQFQQSGTALSLDGTELWQIYMPWSNQVASADHHNVLVRRPSGEWIVFLSDGREWHFAAACDACSDPSTDPFCKDAASGGRARLVKAIDERGSAVQLSYDRAGGLLLGLADDLGHSLQIRGSSACGSGRVTELRYDGMIVATYAYSGLDLTQALDADGVVMRSYAYDTSTTGRLVAVNNQAGESIAEFSYDATGRATGVIDKYSSVAVDYDNPGGILVTEFHGDTSSGSLRKLGRDGHVKSISDDCACGPARTLQWSKRRLTNVSDSMGHVTQQDFDASGRLIHRTESGAREEWRDYGIVKPIAEGITLALDRITLLSRNSAATGTKYVAESYSYDPAPQPIDPAGYSCQEAALPVGSVVCRQVTGGYTYDASGTVYFERHATFFSYDSLGRIIRTYGPINLDRPSPGDVAPIEERAYWPNSESLARRGRLLQVSRYPAPNSTPLVTSYDYDAFGPYRVTQPNGAATTIVKDGRGRPLFVLGPDGLSRETRYHDGLDPRLQLLPSGAVVRSAYDGMGRLASVEYLSGDPEASGSTPILGWGEYYTYDQAGNRIHTERRDANGAVTWQQDRQYDVQHRLTVDTNPANPATNRAMIYDPSGFLASTTDEEGRATVYTPDALNRVGSVRRTGLDAQGVPVGLNVAAYQYVADSLSAVSDGNSLSTNYQHDDFGRLTSLSSSNLKGGQVRFSYDARGNLLQRRDGYVTLSYTYDGLDRVLTVSASNSVDGSVIAYAYHYDEPGGEGQLTSVVEPERTMRYGYDGAGRVMSETVQENAVSVPLVTQYFRDADGVESDVIYPSGLHVQLVRDPATRQVVQVKNVADGTRYADQITRLPGGPVGGLLFGNGLALSRTFNRRYEPQTISSGPLSLGYDMSPAGDVQAISDASTVLSSCQRNTTRTFQYDFLDRLVSSPGWLGFGYDGNGNRTSETVEGAAGSYAYSYDQVARKVVPMGAGQVARYGLGYDYQTNVSGLAAFDATGTNVANAMCLRHDALGRMVLAGTPSASYLTPPYFDGSSSTVCTQDSQVETVTARFKYDARGRRIARWLATTSQWTYIVSDPSGNPLSELALTSDPANPWMRVRDYVWLDGMPVAQIEYPGPEGSAQGYVYYDHLDHIGLPRALTNANGLLVWNTFAKPYGDIAEKQTIDPLSGRVVVTNLRLPGQYDERLLNSLGLQGPYYNWNRWYLPGVGRYLELDPIATAGGFNTDFVPDWYNYALGNPLRYYDPDGLFVILPWPWLPKPNPQPMCPAPPPAPKRESEICKLDPARTTPSVPGPPGSPGFPGQCVYKCPSGRMHIIPAGPTGCDVIIILPL